VTVDANGLAVLMFTSEDVPNIDIDQFNLDVNQIYRSKVS
jgi:hypothetical protein